MPAGSHFTSGLDPGRLPQPCGNGSADPAEEWPEWSQPVGAHDAYNAGDKVSHNGKHWTSAMDGNVWEPGTYGWDEITE